MNYGYLGMLELSYQFEDFRSYFDIESDALLL